MDYLRTASQRFDGMNCGKFEGDIFCHPAIWIAAFELGSQNFQSDLPP